MRLHRPNVLAIALALALGALISASHASASDRATVTFANCTEFVGLAPVSLTEARRLVPAQYTLATDNVTATLVVRVADCRRVRVGRAAGRAGTVAQVGILITSPDGTATDPNTSINNYTLTYASNSRDLVELLREARIPAVLDADLAYEFAPTTGPSELYAAVTPGPAPSPTWFIDGTVTTPGFTTRFLANWWSASRGRDAKMSTDIPDISFDFTSAVAFHTASGNVLGRLIGGTKIERLGP